MKPNTAKRLLLFFTAIPILIIMVWFDPTPQLFVMNIFAICAGIGASMETGKLFGMRIHRWRTRFGAAILGAVPAFLGFLVILLGWDIMVFYAGIMITLTVVLTYVLSVFPEEDKKVSFYAKAGVALTLTIYPGAFIGHFILFTLLDHSKLIILLFFLTIFLNDSLAYVGGKLFGKYSNHPFPLSPKKTTIGLIFGLVTSVVFMGIGSVIFPQLFPLGPLSAMLLGLVTGALGVAGDLLESGFKRSAGVKDSGNLIPGRGGIMDSLDSAIFAAPIFFFAFLLFQS